jgi:hypothetical protein
MNIPEGTTRGRLLSFKPTGPYRQIEDHSVDFIITGKNLDINGKIESYYIKFNRPHFYALKSSSGYGENGEITRRKNETFMFRGHSRLYNSYKEEVVFFQD